MTNTLPENSVTKIRIPAFPEVCNDQIVPGMELRDWFAGMALQGMLAHNRNGQGYRPRTLEQHWHNAISEEAYELADAMLQAKEE